MEDITQIVIVPLITTICYISIEMYKYIVKGRKNAMRLIPAIAAVLGTALGVTSFYAAPDIIPATNVLTAVLIGAVSGLAATGANQILKQLGKFSKDNIIKLDNKIGFEETRKSTDENSESVRGIDDVNAVSAQGTGNESLAVDKRVAEGNANASDGGINMAKTSDKGITRDVWISTGEKRETKATSGRMPVAKTKQRIPKCDQPNSDTAIVNGKENGKPKLTSHYEVMPDDVSTGSRATTAKKKAVTRAKATSLTVKPLSNDADTTAVEGKKTRAPRTVETGDDASTAETKQRKPKSVQPQSDAEIGDGMREKSRAKITVDRSADTQETSHKESKCE